MGTFRNPLNLSHSVTMQLIPEFKKCLIFFNLYVQKVPKMLRHLERSGEAQPPGFLDMILPALQMLIWGSF